MKRFNVTISPSKYLGRFHQALANQMAEMRNTLRGLDSGALFENAARPSQKSGMTIQFGVDVSVASEAAAGACNRCFIGLVREFLFFLDRMIALKRIRGEQLEVPRALKSREELEDLIESRLDERYQVVARDQSLTNPNKLAQFPALPDLAKHAARSYFALRRCLEHHGGIPAKEMRLHTVKVVFLADDKEVQAFPFSVAAGTMLAVRADEVTHVFPGGTPVRLSEEQLEQVFLTLQHWVGPSVMKAV